VLVTGSRGKSNIVRLLHTAFGGAGLTAYARITGVLPRELGPGGSRTISRPAGAHVGEMRWWLRQLPATTQAIVMENSAISPDLQHLAGRWLKPDVTVLSNALPDHQEAWGPSSASAAEVLSRGIPKGGKVVLPGSLQTDQHLQALLRQRRCELQFATPAPGITPAYRAVNLGLALATAEHLGLAVEPALQAMLAMPGDDYDFRVVEHAGAELAMAFSVNDITSTRVLFESLQWTEQETRLVYNHRADRPARLRSFIGWLNGSAWREVLIIGDRPMRRTGKARYRKISNKDELLALLQPGERVFGCGNIAGLPMTLVPA
jgi:hypothetical protein